MLQDEMSTKIEGPEHLVAFVDHLTPAGSAFAATVEGDAVFISNRLVDLLGLTQEEINKGPVPLRCFVLLNYEDKRATCRFRALTATRLAPEVAAVDKPADPKVEAVNKPAPNETSDDQYYHNEKIILEALEKQGPMSTADLSEILDIDTTSVSNVCRSLHRTGNICRADVYRQLGQQRASLVVWAKHPSDFSIEFD